MKVIIHGGTHKTGTTSLQSALKKHRLRLLDSGIWYPRDGEQQSHFLLNVKRQGWNDTALKKTIAAVRRKGAHTMILSMEGVSTFSEDYFRRLTASLEGCELAYVFTFRHWSQYLPSRWRQYLRRRDSQTLRQYLDRIVQDDHIDCRPDRILDNALGSGNCAVKAVSYDHAVADDGSVLRPLYAAFGFGEDLQQALLSEEPWLHQSTETEPFEIFRLINGVIADMLGLPQDDNYHAVLQGRVIDVPFILGRQKLPVEIISRAREIIPAQDEHLHFGEGWQISERLSRFRHLFTNIGDRPIFPDVPVTDLTCNPAQWQDIAGDDMIRAFAENQLPAILERLEKRRAATAEHMS
ncbi:hypothetical protein FF098_010480 [Parvularcula flava]|uniref:Uncharacterized protein n=1 Tax=Aquisalinus luteolus TaxID=1566827 RepID=A0A8J3ERC7_9PROT|nr:hypothetical protein [Aquisalinus luteolus]NHK28330.1 hypothetical protein [Aquisalinus luteolus]GGH98152.1 hypothetical protein GCM10011355_21070 [Aquisalinus luteolus]